MECGPVCLCAGKGAFMPEKRYYEAYDERYKTAHARGIRWMGGEPTALVGEILDRYGVGREQPILELGCGEGRDAIPLLERGYDLLATDVSPEAVAYCRLLAPEHSDRFQLLDAVKGALPGRYRFIYAVAVLHMLVLPEDREGFYRFVREHLAEDGLALLCTMGDGTAERQSDIREAFELRERACEGGTISVAATSCRMVSFPTWEKELSRAGLARVEEGVTAVEPEFDVMMYAVVRKAD